MPPPEDAPEDAPVILKGKDAIDLWQKGRDAWNKWITQNPHADVDFSDANFSKYGAVFFEGFHFPNGDINFNFATFGDGGVSFDFATFGKGDVSFQETKFGDGDVNFVGATFGDGDVSFDRATFGDGYVSFNHAKFGDDNVSFQEATFGDGDVNFIAATFGDGYVSFNLAKFGDGNVNLGFATFGDGDVSFGRARFGKGYVAFDSATFEGRFILVECENTPDIIALSLLNCHFKSAVSIKAALTCVPDLCGTIVSAHVDLDNLHISPNTLSAKDAGKYRRLKELAEQNRDHEAALRFFAAERRCARWASGPEGRKSILSRAKILPELTYDELSNYGQSIGRPVLYLLGLIAVTGTLYWSWADYTHFWGAFEIALSDSIPFMPFVRQIGPETDAVLATAPYTWRVLHHASSFILLFLIGLGLRNRLRL